MTQTDPLSAVADPFGGAQTPTSTAPAPQPQPIQSIPDEAWKTTLAVIGGVLAGDRYPNNTPPPLPGPDASIGGLSDATMQNEQQQMQEQAIAAENKFLSQQNSTPPGTNAGGTPAPGGGDWRVDVLNGIGAPVTQQNLDVLAKWQKAEGGGGVAGGPTPSNYNWLNTTRGMPGATSINSVGVKSYASYQDGIAATIGALTNGLYGNIIGALRSGTDELAVAEAIANSPWGTGGLVVKMLGGGGGVPGGTSFRIR